MVTVRAEPHEDGWVCAVAVDESGMQTAHRVTVGRSDLERWGAGPDRADVEDLVCRSFEFLLEREPPTAILKEFELAIIQRYFAEYDRIISSR